MSFTDGADDLGLALELDTDVDAACAAGDVLNVRYAALSGRTANFAQRFVTAMRTS